MARSFQQQFSHTQTWEKLKAIKGIRCLVENALIFYSLLLDGDVPRWVKAICLSAIEYLVLPTDSIPDVIPLMGYTDDLLCLSTAMAAINGQVKPQHKQHANDLFEQL